MLSIIHRDCSGYPRKEAQSGTSHCLNNEESDAIELPGGGSPRYEIKMRKEEKMAEKWLLETCWRYLPQSSGCAHIVHTTTTTRLATDAALAVAQTEESACMGFNL